MQGPFLLSSFHLSPFFQSLGLTQDLSSKGLGVRSMRFALILSRGTIQWVGLNDESFVDAVLSASAKMVSAVFDIEACLKAAKAVSNLSHSPYGADSACGVAIQSDIGITTGCTVDNCAYPNSICGVKYVILYFNNGAIISLQSGSCFSFKPRGYTN